MPINQSDFRSDAIAALAPRHLAAFVAIADSGGFAAAGAAIGLAQSSVSTLLRDMEARLGTRLVERTTRRATLTATGFRLLPHARRLLADMQAVLREVAPAEGRPLRVAATSLIASTLLPRALAMLAASPGAARPLLLEASPTEVPDLVRRGEALLGLGSFPRSEVADLGRRHLGKDDVVLFCPKDHPLAANWRKVCRWRDLAGIVEVAVTRNSEVGRVVTGALEAAGVPPRAPAYEVARIQTALALVAAGLGVAALPVAAATLVPRGHGTETVAMPLRPVVRREVLAIWRGAAEPREVRGLLRALAGAARKPG
jgi:DNA-binding transcriptional LysR family regulator